MEIIFKYFFMISNSSQFLLQIEIESVFDRSCLKRTIDFSITYP